MSVMDDTRESQLTEDEVNGLLDDNRDAGWEDDEAYDWDR